MKVSHIDLEKIEEKIREMRHHRLRYIEKRDDYRTAYATGWIDALIWVLKLAGEGGDLIMLADTILKKEVREE